jgi:hypothetical protein
MAPDAPGFNPLFLNIGLATLGTDEHAFHIVHFPDFLHTASTVAVRIAQVVAGLQGKWARRGCARRTSGKPLHAGAELYAIEYVEGVSEARRPV